MPFLVRVTEGDNPREIAENVDDVTAHSMAQSISAATGETVELVPYEYDHDDAEWKLAEHATTTLAVTVDDPSVQVVNLDDLDDEALNLLAGEHDVADWNVDADIEEKRAILSGLLGIERTGDGATAGEDEPPLYDIESMDSDALDALAAEWGIADWDASTDVETKRSILNGTHTTAVGQAPNFDAMTGDELNAYAEQFKVDGYTRKIRRKSVDERRAFIVAWFEAQSSGS